MPRPRTAQPKYRLHLSGQAVATFSERDYYLGEHGSPQSHVRYATLLRVYAENGLRIPADIPTHQIEAPITVAQVLDEWKERVKDRSALVRYRPATVVMDLEYDAVPAAEFGPRKLRELRETLFADGKSSRKWINEQIRAVCKVFKHAVSCELIEWDTPCPRFGVGDMSSRARRYKEV